MEVYKLKSNLSIYDRVN